MENPLLNVQALTLPKEKTYFGILITVSCVVWLVCVVTIVPLVILAIALLSGWLAHGMLIARLRSEGVKIEGEQMPELSAAFAEVCARLELAKVPELYVIQAGGLLNAFATRFSARDFVVLYSDVLEAYGPASGEIKFLLGHEIGHVRSRHILKNALVLPGLLLPLLGSAYSRACESSCDRHGAFASEDLQGSVRAMMILSGGKEAGRTMMAEAFSRQHFAARGFFVSLHELFSGYPTLSKRVSDLLDLQHERTSPRPGRNPLALLLALFCPGARFGVFGVVAIIYLFAFSLGIALPVFSKVKERAAQVQRHAAEMREEAKEEMEGSLDKLQPTPAE